MMVHDQASVRNGSCGTLLLFVSQHVAHSLTACTAMQGDLSDSTCSRCAHVVGCAQARDGQLQCPLQLLRNAQVPQLDDALVLRGTTCNTHTWAVICIYQLIHTVHSNV